MNPYVDLLGWTVVALCVVGLWCEVPRAVREIRKILAKSRAVERHISQGGKSLQQVYWDNSFAVDGTGRLCDMKCPTCDYTTSLRFWHRCPSCGSGHQPV